MTELLPRPFSRRNTEGKGFAFTENTVWAGERLDASWVVFWRGRFLSLLGKQEGAGSESEIRLELDPEAEFPCDGIGELLTEEAYRLTVSERSVRICARDQAGLVWGLQSLWQLMAAQAGKSEITVEAQEITDAPRFGYRGCMLDVARHFFPLETVKRLLDAMSLMKLNRFHWHLTDEQGWRIEIKRYPRLTEVGSIRRETRGDGVVHQGFYSQDEIADVVRYAGMLGIEVIPEIDAPGHFGAAIAAYPELSCRKEPLDVRTVFGIFPEIACAGSEYTFEFMQGVLEEVCGMFPGRYVHLGGDEVPKDRWRECPACRERMRQERLGKTSRLQQYLLNRLARFLKERGKTAVCWNDSAAPGGLEGSTVMQYWMGGKNESGSAAEMNAGRPTIVSPIGNYYFDYPYGMTGLKKAYGLLPLPKGAQGASALGIEAALWTEFIPDEKRLQYMLFPRLAAVAERAWLPVGEPDYRGIAARLTALEPMWRMLGIEGAPLAEAYGSGFRAFLGKLGFVRNMLRGVDFKMLRTVVGTALGREED